MKEWGKSMKNQIYLLIICCFTCAQLLANVSLDDFNVRKNVAYSFNPQSNELTITLKNVQITNKTGSGPLGKLIGSYPNPKFKPFTEGFVLGGQSPHCLVYQIKQ